MKSSLAADAAAASTSPATTARRISFAFNMNLRILKAG
jgi:hypothetical protein